MPSIDVIVRARNGDSLALEQLIREYQQSMGRFVVLQIAQDDEYLDLCQTIFVKMTNGFSKLKNAEEFESWLFQIARNVCRDFVRLKARQRKMFTQMQPSHDVAEEDFHPSSGLRNSIEAIEEVLHKLAPKQRQLVALYVSDRYSYSELAAHTDTTVASVRNRLSRARTKLRQFFEELGGARDDHES